MVRRRPWTIILVFMMIGHHPDLKHESAQGILSKFDDMFKDKQDATHLRAAEVMRELGWHVAE